MANRSSIVTVKHIDSNGESIGSGHWNNNTVNAYKVLNVKGKKPKLITRPKFGDNKILIKIVETGGNISDIEKKALENSCVIVEYREDLTVN